MSEIKNTTSNLINNKITNDQLKNAISAVKNSTTNDTDTSSSSLYLYGAMAQLPLINLIRGQCIQEDVDNLPTIMSNWEKATKLFHTIESQDLGIAGSNPTMDIDGSYPKLAEISNSTLFKNTFLNSPIEFKLIDIDRLIAPQRHVSLNYVQQLEKIIPNNPSMDDLIDICISPIQNVFPVKTLQQAQNMCVFSSPSNDFRFLGGFIKNELTDDDLRYCLEGGNPVSAIILFVGYGGGSVNVYQVNNRLILNNGFHRVYALRKKGITKIPVVIQKIGNPEFEFPPQILGLTSNYLLNHPRPVMVKDFFVKDLTTVLRMKKTVRTVQIQWGTNQLNMAV
jgi:hypothetical protein